MWMIYSQKTRDWKENYVLDPITDDTWYDLM